MALLARLRTWITPDCGHADTITDLERRCSTAEDLVLASDELSRVRAEQISSLRARVVELEAELARRADIERDLIVSLESLSADHQTLNAMQAILERRLEDAGGDAAVSDRDVEQQIALVAAEPSRRAAKKTALTGPDTKETDSVSEALYRIAAPWFEGGRHSWELACGSQRLRAVVTDAEFVEAVQRREHLFGCGDNVRVLLRTQTFSRPNGSLFAKHFITRVLEVIPAPLQQQFQPMNEVIDATAHSPAA